MADAVHGPGSTTVRALGFDDRFIRMWEYYLALSEAGFATGISQDLQIVFEKRRGTRGRRSRLIRGRCCPATIP